MRSGFQWGKRVTVNYNGAGFMIKGQLPSMQHVISKEIYSVVSGENTDCSSHKEKV